MIIKGCRWEKNGDHYNDPKGTSVEGKVVRYYRHPYVSGTSICPFCQEPMHDHGFIDEIPSKVVCPGSYVLELDTGKHIVVNQEVFLEILDNILHSPLKKFPMENGSN